MLYLKEFLSCAGYSSLVPMRFHSDDGISFYRNVCEYDCNILAIIFLLKLSLKTHLNPPPLSPLSEKIKF